MANINVKNMIFGNFFMDKSIAPMDGWFTKSWHINNFLFMNMAAWQALCIYIYYYIHMFFFSLSLSLSFSPSLPPSHGHETNSRCKTLSVWLYICSLAFHLSWFACMHTCVCEREWVWVCVCVRAFGLKSWRLVCVSWVITLHYTKKWYPCNMTFKTQANSPAMPACFVFPAWPAIIKSRRPSFTSFEVEPGP